MTVAKNYFIGLPIFASDFESLVKIGHAEEVSSARKWLSLRHLGHVGDLHVPR